jgi:Tol biopolymer transport system component
VQILKTLADHSPFEVRCSPDGRYIAYDYPPRDDSANRDIFLLATDGSDEAVLVARPEDDRLLDWTPDGKHLLFTSGRTSSPGTWMRTGSPSTWLLQVADGEPRGEPVRVEEFAPSRGLGFTRDGAYYYSWGPPDQPSANDVYLVDRDSKKGRFGTPEKFIENIATTVSVAWSPDGRQLASVTWDRGFVIRSVESGEERQIRPGIGHPGVVYPHSALLQWMPDGRSLIAQGRGGIYKIDIQSGEAETILEVAECCIGESVWSPSGKVFFTRWKSEKRGEPLSVVTRDLESGREIELHRVTSPVTASNLSVSPDGRWLAFIEWDMEKGTASLKVMPANGGEIRSLLAFSKVRFYRKPRVELTWTPDSRHIVYALSSTGVPRSSEPEIRWFPQESGEQDDFELWQVPVEDGEPERLGVTMKGLIPYGLSISPDGQRIAFTAGRLSSVYDPIWVLQDFLPSLKSPKSKRN